MGSTVRRKPLKTTAASKRGSQPLSKKSTPRGRRSPPRICRTNAPQVGFGDLAAELRNQIYQAALTPGFGADVRIVRKPDGIVGRGIALGLLASCKAIRREAWSFLYEHNTFRIDCVESETKHFDYGTTITGGLWEGYRILDEQSGYQHKYNYIPPVKSYQTDFAKFLNCTNHKLGLQSIHSISLGYYADGTLLSKDAGGKVQAFPERADLVVAFRLLKTSPFFSITIDHTLSNDERSERKTKVIEDVSHFMRIQMNPLDGPKKMCKDIMVEFVEQSYRWCRSHSIGV